MGKSSLARLLGDSRPGWLTVISQDSFFGAPFVPYADALRLGEARIEGPEHIDWAAMRQAVRVALESGNACLVEVSESLPTF